ncbi:MAG TPA: type III pantothenate kinase [Eubacteriales bacterium]|nr:type III pantothenate kinase [Eubacteriales bacterium]
MLLAIDIGNTNIKLGLFKNNVLTHSWKMSTDVKRTADEVGAVMKQLFTAQNIDESLINAAIISSVIPQLNYTIEHALQYYFHLNSLFVEAGVKTGLHIKYENPKELGADRIVNCVAAIKKYGAPFILTDFGTATTFSVVNGKNEFIGGAISIGMKTAVEALARNTAQLPRVELIKAEKAIGNSTIKGIQSGVIFSNIGATKYIIEKIKKEMNEPNVKVIATGGLSELITDQEPLFDIIDRGLSLEGLNIIYNLNK